MSENDEPTVDDVLPVHERAIPDRREHGKMPKHLDDEELERRTEHERVEVGLEDYDPNEVPPATD
jgi:hypothetical protein